MDPRQQKYLNSMKYSDVSHNTPALRWDQIRFIQGEPLTAQLAIDRKHLVVLELWATWCPPCREAIPLINQLQHHIAPEGVQVIGITAEDDEDHVKKFIAKMGKDMTYRVAIDEQGQMDEWRERFNCPGIPFAFIIDWTGTIRWAGNPMMPPFINKLKTLLDERDASPSTKSSTKPVATPAGSEATISANDLRAISDDELKAKPVKELIALLKGAKIDISGCLEKSEFIDRLRGKATI